MINKKNILVCIDWFLPAYKAGGPIQSINNIISHFNNDINFWIYTSNKDLNEDLDLGNIKLNTWSNKNGYRIMYSDKKLYSIFNLIQILKNQHFDFIYLNSMFSVGFSFLPMLVSKFYKKRLIIAPRGMLGAEALEIKPLRKKFFLNFFKIFSFHKNILWHATDITESNEIILRFGKNLNILIAPNLSKKINWNHTPKSKLKNSLKIFFLSRISVKKNLEYALELLKKINNKLKIDFTIIGPVDELKYWNTCQKIIKTLPSNISISYLGSIPNSSIHKTLNKQHVMLLPTKHENFGHVIVESWQSGCPVIISDNTPWRNLKSKKIGFDINNSDAYGYIEAINFFAEMDEFEFNSWSEKSFNFGRSFSMNKSIVKKTKNIFKI